MSRTKPFVLPPIIITSTYDVEADSNNIIIAEILVGSALNLPDLSVVYEGFPYFIRNSGSANLTVTSFGAQTINGNPTVVLLPSESIMIISNTSSVEWNIVLDVSNSVALPLTTKGDMLVHNGTTNVRQGVGTNNTILIADSVQANGIKWASVDLVLPLTTKGDLMVNNGTINIRQAVGANNTITIADSAQTSGIKWGSVDLVLPLTTKGDLMVNNGTANIRQAVGADNTITIADSAQTSGIKWGSVNLVLPLTTKGDLMVNNGTTNIRLAVGADNTILTADAAQASGVKWAASSGGNLYKFSMNTYAVASAVTHTFIASEFIKEENFSILRSGAAGAVTDYTPTAASMVAALPVADRVVGHTRLFYFINIDANGTGSKFEFKDNSIDATQPASVKIVNTGITRAMTNGVCTLFLLRFTNVGGGTEAANLYLIGAGA